MSRLVAIELCGFDDDHDRESLLSEKNNGKEEDSGEVGDINNDDFKENRIQKANLVNNFLYFPKLQNYMHKREEDKKDEEENAFGAHETKAECCLDGFVTNYNLQIKDKSVRQQKVVSFRPETIDDSQKEMKKKKPNMDTFINLKDKNVTKRPKRSLNEIINRIPKLTTTGNQGGGYSKNLVLREANVALGLQKASGERTELGEGKNAVGMNEWEEVKNKMHQGEVDKVNNPAVRLFLQVFKQRMETDYEPELKDIKARMSIKSMESKFRKTANSSAQIANKTGFQAAARKREFQGCLQEKDYKTGLNDIKNRMEFKFRKTAKSSAQTDKSTAFQTANDKNVLISEKGKKLLEGLLNEFHQSENNGDIENNLLCIQNKIISKKQIMLPEKKTFNTSLTSRKEEEYYPKCSGKLSTDEKKSNIKVEDDEECGEIGNNYANIILSEWVLTQDNSKQFACLQTDDTPLLAVDDESKQAI
uniref:Uncharacterized protein n=1 Tax=Glossina pallidipes TaxID=7398 RepID=A0A1B0A3K5_GLOPL